MSTSPQQLEFDIQRESPPCSADELEAATWASLRIRVAGRLVTEFWNDDTGQLEDHIYVPLFPIVEWTVKNWWALLHEPCPYEQPTRARASSNQAYIAWLHRHCIQSADSGLVLPRFHIFSNGPSVCVAWEEDQVSFSAIRYWSSRSYLLNRGDVRSALGRFVDTVMSWCKNVHNARVSRLRLDWDAIKNAGHDEEMFCVAAGHLGLDPYDLDHWPGGIQSLITDELGDHLREPIATDFLEATDCSNVSTLWNWILTAQSTFHLSKHPAIWTGPDGFQTGKDWGYHLARQVREQLKLNPSEPLDEISTTIQSLGDYRFRFEDHNHLPSKRIEAIVGWTSEQSAIVAGPRRAYPEESTRFLMARGLFQVFTGCADGARLLTNAKTWPQQAGRAFAAELLAPQEGVAVDADEDLSLEERKEFEKSLAQKYRVSTMLVEHQLQNQGIWCNL